MIRAFTLVLFIVCSSALSLSAKPAPRPNILYIYADDLGWGYIGANGQSKVKTPSLDSLAASGVNFTRGYGCTVCSPARSSQQTGFHQGHTWTDRNDPDASKAIRADDKTIGDVLSAAGYRTAYFGKWGYGASQDQNNPTINNTQTLPINHGYDVVMAELHHVRAHTFFQPTLWRSNTADSTPTTALVPNAIPNNTSLPEYPAYQSDPAYPSPAYCDDTYAMNALEFVRTEAQDTSKPFFCLLAFQIPHTPLGEITDLPKWFDEYSSVDTSGWTGNSKQFAAMVTRMDAHIGNILAALEDPNSDGDKSDSVLDNTLIVFASDNGGQSSGGAGDALNEFNGNGVLRGAKGSIYEGAIRVPMLMKWQGKLASNTVSSQIVDVTDMLPTFCELAGVPAPAGLDGVSLAPTLTGEGHQRTREFVIHEAGGNSSIIRGQYKLVSTSSSRALYDLDADPSESSNIAGADAALADELESLLIGERTKEADNFANTYHHWTGANGANTSDANNWSDYEYSNAGSTFLSDNGAPRVSWTATMKNTTSTDATATADASFETLSLHILGDTHQQTLDLSSHTLTGRNEIRISDHGRILLDNGTLDTLRWVDLEAGGTLTGAGNVTGTLYHAGQLNLTQSASISTPGMGPELIKNGGFENGNGTGDYSYTALDDWFTDGPSPDNDGAKKSSPKSGSYRGLVQGNATPSNLVQNTGALIALGDSFTFSFWHQGFSNWATGEQIEARVYYLSGTTPVDIFTNTVALTSGVWNQSSFTIPAINDTNAVGKEIHVSFTPTNGATGFASLDDVSLTKVTEPTTLPGTRKLSIAKSYHAYESASTDLSLGGNTTAGTDYSQLLVSGSATVDGSLTLTLDDGYAPSVGDTFTILTAGTVQGRFKHADDIITVGNHHFKILYNPQSIVLKAIAVTTKGTPHSWLDGHELDNDYEVNDLDDIDNDGMPTWQEFIAGTDPTASNSIVRVEVSLNPDTGKYELSWELKPDRLYYVESSNTLTSFSPLAGPITGDTLAHVFTIPDTGEPSRFYRVRVARR
ncbi:hypothetical protein NT6N_05850 [Oceaniferula spumae]|uniref:Sulfatase N-terminal domain-containing protein n=1 Tax=Oceaniferula spumae TaxID=2979115 RepID=A0AAT9FHV9_9BACT